MENEINMYEGLAWYVLPAGILAYFEVRDFAESAAPAGDVLYQSELHIYLDERDNRTPEMAGSVSNGFGKWTTLLDFPIRDRKAVLHFRRRRWTMPDGTTMQVDIDRQLQLHYPGTRYSKEFALFLKKADG